MRLLYYRYFINPTGSLFQAEIDKKDLMKDLLANPIFFWWAKKTELAFTPTRFLWEDFLVWLLGKKSMVKIAKWPETNFSEVQEENRPHTLVAMNFSNDPDKGQTIAIEYKSNIFPDPLTQLRNLFDDINKDLSAKWYVIQIAPILEPHQFWDTINQVQEWEKVISVEFTLNVPNLFWIQDELNDELRNAQTQYNATQAEFKLSNEQEWLSLNQSNPFLDQSVSYIERWWWQYKIKMTWNKIINSESGAKATTLDFDLDITTSDDATLALVLNQIFND